MLCTSNTQLNLMVQQVINDEGEGVILQKCGSLYEPGRTPDLLKLKVLNIFADTFRTSLILSLQIAQGDKEAIVISVGNQSSVTLKLYAQLIGVFVLRLLPFYLDLMAQLLSFLQKTF
jgi:hypothetical protein